jgi:hypothetical protein
MANRRMLLTGEGARTLRWVAAGLAIALSAAACGSTTPSPTDSGRSPAGSSADASSADASSADASSPATAPTPESGQVARIEVVACPAQRPASAPTAPPIPATMTATVTSDVAATVSFYSSGDLTVLGPKGWSCTASLAADGTARMAIVPPGSPLPSPPATPPADASAVTAVSVTSCTDCVVRMACPFFPEAVRLAAGTCPSTIPSGESVRRSMPRAVVFDDPPGVAGSGEPSGGTERALGLVVFDPGAAAGGSQRGPNAMKVTCTLPASMSAVCDEVVEQH